MYNLRLKDHLQRSPGDASHAEGALKSPGLFWPGLCWLMTPAQLCLRTSDPLLVGPLVLGATYFPLLLPAVYLDLSYMDMLTAGDFMVSGGQAHSLQAGFEPPRLVQISRTTYIHKL